MREAILAVAVGELRGDGGQLVRAAPDQDHPGAESRQLVGGLTPEAGCRPGDEHGPARKRGRRRVRPVMQPPAHHVSNASEAADDGQLEKGVHDVAQHVTMMTHIDRSHQ